MCEKCKAESDDDYEGNSIEEKRRKAVASIVQRHPDLNLDSEDIVFRFVPKYKWRCVRVNLNTSSPRYEIHVPTGMGPVMSSGPSLTAIAQAAFIETDKSYKETCEILNVEPRATHEALFLADEPPVNPVRVHSHADRAKFDQKITNSHTGKE